MVYFIIASFFFKIPFLFREIIGILSVVFLGAKSFYRNYFTYIITAAAFAIRES
jgi:hypothetical protein